LIWVLKETNLGAIFLDVGKS